jgi:3-deoxy-7-phosphoheptulonate synthase
VVGGVLVPSFRGDNINRLDPSQRAHDPTLLVEGYFHAAATLNYCRVVGALPSVASPQPRYVG